MGIKRWIKMIYEKGQLSIILGFDVRENDLIFFKFDIRINSFQFWFAIEFLRFGFYINWW